VILETYKLRAVKPLIEKRLSPFTPVRKDEVLLESLWIGHTHLTQVHLLYAL
jgi:hypothetical protein